jgi:hypothetical protein
VAIISKEATIPMANSQLYHLFSSSISPHAWRPSTPSPPETSLLTTSIIIEALGIKEEMKRSTSIIIEALGEKYLGLPMAVGHSTTEAFEPILAKVRGLVGG